MRKHFAIAALLCAGLAVHGNAQAGSCASASGATSQTPSRLETEAILDDVALIHSIDPDLLSAMAQVESNQCSDAISPKGAIGLMQLMPATAATYGVDNRFDPVQNALGAARFIDYLKRQRPDGKLTLPEIIAAYNAGEGAVTRAGGIPHYRETEEYVRRVLWLYLVGHVPKSQLAAIDAPPHAAQGKSHPAKIKPARRPLDGDSAILDQLAEVRRAREQSDATAGAAAQ